VSEPTDEECFEAQAAIERLITFTQKREPRDRGLCIFAATTQCTSVLTCSTRSCPTNSTRAASRA
jgi:hypothetical protein